VVVKNGTVSALASVRKCGYILTTLALVLVIGGCGHTKPPTLISADPSTVSAPPSDPRSQLAGLVAAAQDKALVATYTLATDGRADRTVLVSRATDASTRVDVPAGAASGGANVSIVSNPQGTYQCLLGGPATTLGPAPTPTVAPSASASASASPSGTPAPPRYLAPACVRVAGPGAAVPARYDSVIPHVFTDWMAVMTDRTAPIQVFVAAALPHSTGQCYSVEPSSASIEPAMQAGIFCYLPDGTLTAAAITHNTLMLDGTPAPAPPTNPLPGPVTKGPAAPVKAP
jgi:hypothetical protein